MNTSKEGIPVQLPATPPLRAAFPYKTATSIQTRSIHHRATPKIRLYVAIIAIDVVDEDEDDEHDEDDEEYDDDDATATRIQRHMVKKNKGRIRRETY